ncbi:MAG: bifunctional 3,4-dihydroxy-2-butanone-4-phosphate synthase/GTP cyclohydrolase II [Bacteriovoracaceae bacterium]|nr:bifunctional 3,4-dihydroxy-2-butanone-4-phosphate synthase/GTP cyclohydrolase II [Bacteriovoracaceae bacterium]
MLNTIEEAIIDINAGKMIIVVDDENRENEGDFVMAAEKITPQAINLMATYGRGMICTPISEKLAEKLNLTPMVPKNTSNHATAFTVTIDAAKGISTGISSHDRARTVALLADEKVEANDFVRPGHIFPLIARDGGILKRPGHTEAAVDLARLAGLKPVGVICEITNPDGTMARLEELKKLAQEFQIKIISIEDLITYRRKHEMHLKKDETIDFPSQYGQFKLHTFIDQAYGEEYVVLTSGEIKNNSNPIVRIHSQCLTGDVFGSQRCDCGEQRDFALKDIADKGGIFIYQPKEGRGIGLMNKIKAYKIQEEGYDTIEANRLLGFADDLRDYSGAAQILKTFGLTQVQLMTNNPKKISGLENFGITVSKRVPIEIAANKSNSHYLTTKKMRMGHMLGENQSHLQ